VKPTHAETNDAKKPWRLEWVPNRLLSMPGMLDREARTYFHWLGRNWPGGGEAVELGSWLGCASCCFVSGAMSNPRLHRQKLQVIDSFIWQSWMDKHCKHPFFDDGLPRPGESFEHLFWHFAGPYRTMLDVRRVHFGGRRSGPSGRTLHHTGERIGLLINDLWHDENTCQQIWAQLSPRLMPGALLVLCQYGAPHAKSLRHFVSQKTNLTPVHILSRAVASFAFYP
jgi:hypothetical protein